MAGGGVTATFAKRELLKLTLRLSPKKWAKNAANFLGDIPNRIILGLMVDTNSIVVFV